MPPFIKRIFPLLLAVGLLVYALKDISFHSIGKQFQQANYGLIALVGFITIVSYFLRGKRWQQSILAMGYHPTAFRTTIAMQTGVVSSMIILGSGEITRCATLQRTDGVPISQGMGSVVAERIIDLFMMMIVLLLTVLLELGRMKTYLLGLTLAIPSTYAVLGAIGIVAVAGIIGLWAIRTDAIQTYPLMIKVIKVFQGFGQGFMAIRKLPKPGLFVLLTFLNQFLAWLGTYLLLLAVDSTQNLPPTTGLTIMAVSSLGGLAVPTQGGIGTYHFLVSRALILYGFTATQGAAIATFLHAIGFGFNLLLSSISFLILPMLIANGPAKSTENIVE